MAGPGGAGGPVIPTASALAAQRPLAASGARLTGGLLHAWQRRNASASMPLALRQLVVAGNLDNLRLAIRAGAGSGALFAPGGQPPGDALFAPGGRPPGDALPAPGGRPPGDPPAWGDCPSPQPPLGQAPQEPPTLPNAQPSTQAPPGQAPQEPPTLPNAQPSTQTPPGQARQRPPSLRAAQLGPVDPLPGLGYHGPIFMDSDIYKTLEAIGWELANGTEPAHARELSEFAAAATGLIRQAQQPDGYLNSYVQASGEPRYTRLAMSHEMYCAGHLIQAAIALRRGAGDPRPLEVATRLADHLVREFAGQARGLDGHPVIETALTELYRETGTRAYLDLASQFVDQRGHGLAGESSMGRRYLQDHMPVRESVTEVGHAVRALYLEAGITDVATETRDDELLASSVRRWDDMVATKTSLTGGNGSRHVDEGFGDRFELPPDRAYNETCAAIASFQWSWRLLLATGDAKYADHMERVLYNGFAAAISAEGDRFFYVNPLQRREDHFEKDDPGRRRVWFTCACCPPNIMRLLASVQHYLATTAGDTLHVQQYAGARLAGADLGVDMVTDYPWSGTVTLRVLTAPAGGRGIALRIPAWCTAAGFTINNSPERTVVPHDGYLLLHQAWQPGDEVVLRLGMSPRWTYPDRRADALRGCAAIERGPLVYCLEQADNDRRLDEMAVTPGVPLTERRITLGGIGATIQVTAPARHVCPVPRPDSPQPTAAGAGADVHHEVHREHPAHPESPQPAAAQPGATPADALSPAEAQVTAVAIPYFQWDNRGADMMRVWIPSG